MCVKCASTSRQPYGASGRLPRRRPPRRPSKLEGPVGPHLRIISALAYRHYGRRAHLAPAPLPVGETGVARARAAGAEGDRPACTSLFGCELSDLVVRAEGRGDRPGRSRLCRDFTLAGARAEPFHVLLQVKRCARTLAVPKARRQRTLLSCWVGGEAPMATVNQSSIRGLDTA